MRVVGPPQRALLGAPLNRKPLDIARELKAAQDLGLQIEPLSARSDFG
jgi:hypothetical protein